MTGIAYARITGIKAARWNWTRIVFVSLGEGAKHVGDQGESIVKYPRGGLSWLIHAVLYKISRIRLDPVTITKNLVKTGPRYLGQNDPFLVTLTMNLAL